MRLTLSAWAVLCAALLGSAAGCSFGLSGPTPHRLSHEKPRCDASWTRPTVDLVVGGIAAASLPVQVAVGPKNINDTFYAYRMLISGAVALVYAVSGFYGLHIVDSCVREHDKFRESPTGLEGERETLEESP